MGVMDSAMVGALTIRRAEPIGNVLTVSRSCEVSCDTLYCFLCCPAGLCGCRYGGGMGGGYHPLRIVFYRVGIMPLFCSQSHVMHRGLFRCAGGGREPLKSRFCGSAAQVMLDASLVGCKSVEWSYGASASPGRFLAECETALACCPLYRVSLCCDTYSVFSAQDMSTVSAFGLGKP